MFVEINMRAFPWDHIFSLSKEWKLIGEEKEIKVLEWITLVLISNVMKENVIWGAEDLDLNG